MIICKICGDEKTSQRSFIYHLKKEHNNLNIKEYYLNYEGISRQYCIYCNNEASFNTKLHKYYSTCSNRSCTGKYAHSVSEKNLKEKYGKNINFGNIPNAREKCKQTKKERYGDENYNNSEKNKQTCLKRYGVTNGSKTENARKKISDSYYKANNIIRRERLVFTLKEKYGVEWNSQDPVICSKIHQTLKQTREAEVISRISDMKFIIIKTHETSYDLQCKICDSIITDVKRYRINRSYLSKENICDVCSPKFYFKSKGEKELLESIKQFYFGEIKENIKMFGYEADIFIKEKNITIEFNGLYWHSELFKDSQYHKNKKFKFAENGINIINVWEDDWNNEQKRAIILSRIKHSLGIFDTRIYARNCKLQEVNSLEARNFINTYHLQGNINSSLKLGLYYNNELVMICTFGKRKLGNQTGFELLRSCSKDGVIVIGGFSKLIKYAINNLKNIYSYVDCDWSDLNGINYKSAKFKFVKYTVPGYFWVVNGKRENRIKFQKHILVKNGANPYLSEEEIMHQEGYYRIYNTGNLLFKFEINV